MEQSPNFQRQEKYKDILLPAISAFAAAHSIVCFEQPQNPIEIVLAEGYPLAMGISYAFALLVFYAVNRVSWRLDKSYPWAQSKWKRLLIQVLAGAFGVMALEVAGAAVYFTLKGHHISETVFFDRYFFMILGYISAINMYYNAEAIVFWKTFGKKSEVRLMPKPGLATGLAEPEVTIKEEEDIKPALKAALLKYLSLHNVVLIYTDNDDIFAKTSDAKVMTWDFRLGITMKVLDPKLYFKVSRYHIVRRDAIDRILPEPLKSKLTIFLKDPYNDQISASRTCIDGFTAWWYTEEG